MGERERMGSNRLRIWPTVGTSVVLAGRSIGTFPITSLAVVALLFAIRSYHFPDAWRGLPGFSIWADLLKMLARTAVLAPFAIMIHRSIVLGDQRDTYWGAWTHTRAIRFFGALFLLNLVEFGATVLDVLTTREWVQETIYGMSAFWTSSLVLWTRLCLTFPIIATDDATRPFVGSYRYTRGSSRRILFVFCVIGAVHIALDALAVDAPSSVRTSIWFDAAWTVASTFFFVIYVCVASHLWRTREAWSGRGDARPAPEISLGTAVS